ncbi:MAG: TonB-dependent receptor [Dysgonamonadaceae bacterium]|jgi:TonB-linked SusC/RagA family outer membrane protein|nr:TonB-dependent receptor [Dysgonamonadaceae bacterium]
MNLIRITNQARKRGTHTILSSFLFVFFLLAACASVFAQQSRTITGVIRSAEDGETLIGALVGEKNTNNKTITDVDGLYSLTVQGNAVLEVSYLGYEPKEVVTGNQNKIDIELTVTTNVLNEVVAIGYGVQQKKLLTGATLQIKGETLVKQNAVSPFAGLQGLTPGVSIVKNNGKPGEGFKVTIRGAGTIHNSEPLYVIDGLSGGNINALNPSDIESIDVLKDAASAAIYGARAANGVILVTTKQAQKGRTHISYDSYYGWQNFKNNVETLGAKDYLMFMEESGLLTGLELNTDRIPMLDKINSGEWDGTNWLDEMTVSNAPLQNHAVNFNKGSDGSAFALGFSYTSQMPIIAVPSDEVGTGYDRYTGRLNSDHTLIKLKDRDLLKIGETMTLFYSDRKGLDQATGHTTWNDFRNAFKANPLFPAYDENGDFEKPVTILNNFEINPVAKMYYNSAMKDSKNYGIRGNFYFILEPIKDLKWRSSYGIDYSSWMYRAYIPAYTLNDNESKERNTVSQQGGMGHKWQIENTLSYDFNLNKTHKFAALLGSSVERSGMGANFSGSNDDVEFDDFYHAYLSNAKTVERGKTSVSGSAWGLGGLVSFFGRLNYDYRNKYMATVVLRADGSSNFAPGRQWGYFPSISAGWNITEEIFMETVKPFLNYLKLRASWGENGNNRIPEYKYLATMTFATNANNAYYYFGDKTNTPSIGAFPEYVPNPDLTWETSRQTDIGVDMMFINNHLGINFDWYHKKTIDWLVQGLIHGSAGTQAPWVNGGDIVNHGIELQLNWNDKIGDFKYDVSANFGHNTNEVVKIANGDNYLDGSTDVLGSGVFYRAEVGKPLGYFIGYRTNGIFQNQAEIDAYVHPETGNRIMPEAKPGDVRFRDLDNDGSITLLDREMIGNPNPDFDYGVNLNFEYKAFDFTVSGHGVTGNQIIKSYRTNTSVNTSNYTSEMFGRWHGEGTSNRLPSLNGTAINWQYVSDLYIENGDYFRITNITLGLDLRKLFQSLPLQQARLYVSGQNLFTFTKYSGLDPEVSAYTGAQAWARGIDLGNYPVARSYLIGLSIKY